MLSAMNSLMQNTSGVGPLSLLCRRAVELSDRAAGKEEVRLSYKLQVTSYKLQVEFEVP